MKTQSERYNVREYQSFAPGQRDYGLAEAQIRSTHRSRAAAVREARRRRREFRRLYPTGYGCRWVVTDREGRVCDEGEDGTTA